ncbi:MAG: chemotaxis protein CheW [Ghiorsea sp.]
MSQDLVPIAVKENTSVELLTCRIGEQWVGFRVQQVREVVNRQKRTHMPLAPEAVAGLINLRGKVITELEVRRVVGLPDRGEDEPFHVAIVETLSGEDFGLIVDDVGEVIVLDEDLFESTPRSLDEVWRQVSDGVLKQEDRVLLLVNVDRFVGLTIPNAAAPDTKEITLH